jgi:hypothetical protein
MTISYECPGVLAPLAQVRIASLLFWHALFDLFFVALYQCASKRARVIKNAEQKRLPHGSALFDVNVFGRPLHQSSW